MTLSALCFGLLVSGGPALAISLSPEETSKVEEVSTYFNSFKTLKGEFVGFGKDMTRGDAEKALDREIAAWEQRSGLKATPKDRNVACKVYIEWLNEFECKAEATVCRKASAQARSKQRF